MVVRGVAREREADTVVSLNLAAEKCRPGAVRYKQLD